MTSEWIDVAPFIGQVHEVFVPEMRRTVSVSVADAGPLTWWDHRPVLALKVTFNDGQRSRWDVADAAAGTVAERIFSPYSIGVVNPGSGFEMETERSQRDRGKRRNGSTQFTFRVFQGPVDMWPRYQAMADAGVSHEETLKRIKADFAALARGEELREYDPRADLALARFAARRALMEAKQAARR